MPHNFAYRKVFKRATRPQEEWVNTVTVQNIVLVKVIADLLLVKGLFLERRADSLRLRVQ